MIDTSGNGVCRVAVVTGGSRGLGRSTVLALANRGVNSLFTYHSKQAEAEKVVLAAAEAGARAVALRLDANDVGAFDSLIERVRAELRGLGAEQFDYLVNNAGNSHVHAPFAKQTVEEFDSLYAVHFRGVYFFTQKMLPLLKDGGRIVNISTGTARFTVPGSSAYSCMKGGVEVLTRYLAKELGARKISVNTVAPGAIETDFSGAQTRDNPERNKMVANATALGRAGLPDDIGPMIALLLSDENHWITGQRIEASGGMFL